MIHGYRDDISTMATNHVTFFPIVLGDGMSSYVTYLVTTKTSLTSFKNHEVFVRRRFSDFLGLYFQLAEKYAQLGRIVPPAPEKSVTGMYSMYVCYRSLFVAL